MVSQMKISREIRTFRSKILKVDYSIFLFTSLLLFSVTFKFGYTVRKSIASCWWISFYWLSGIMKINVAQLSYNMPLLHAMYTPQ